MPSPDLNDPLPVDVAFLRRFALNAFLDSMGLPAASRLRPILAPALWLPAHLFANIGARFDEYVAGHGFDGAARWVLPRFTSPLEVFGAEEVPSAGPLVVACNHPGAVDALALAAHLPRTDLKILAYGIPFVKALTQTARRFIFSSAEKESMQRMLSVRASLRHLRSGGSLLIFPSGHIGPDPGVMPGAQESIGSWSRSLLLFLQRTSGARLQLAFLSHTVLPRFIHHRLARRQNGVPRQILAQYLQTVAQVLPFRSPLPAPKLSFYSPLSLPELDHSGDAFEAILAHARIMLDQHLARYGGES